MAMCFFACMDSGDFTKGEGFDLQGHRGCRGIMPENTIPGMLHALSLGVNTLEMDAVITRDKQVILSHEPFFSHKITTKPDGSLVNEEEEKDLNIYHMTYAETMQFDVGKRAHPDFPEQQKMAAHKPLLKDVFQQVKDYCAKNNLPLPWFNIETKSNSKTDNVFHPAPEEFMDLVWAVVEEAGMQDKTIIQSFDFRTLQALHRKHPEVQTAMLIESFDTRTVEAQIKALGFTPSIYSPEERHISRRLVEKCHDLGMRVIPWTINNPEKASRLKHTGIDGIITDYPDRVK